jgi:trimeric autotransporter adhesin
MSISAGGEVGVAGENNACYIASIFDQTSANGIPVLINSNHKLGTTTSSERFKEDIKPMSKTSETLFALNPVTFRYKKEIDSAGTSQFGLVAEDVEKVNPDLVVRDKDGKPYSVRYEAVNAMLLNEFLKEHRKVERLEKQVEALTAGLQRVSGQLELSKSAPQTVFNDQ